MQDKRVGTVAKRGNVYSSGIAQVLIPYGVDRDMFVQDCLATGFISVQPETSTAIHRVMCDKSVLQTIDFPKTYKELGSHVVYVNLPKHKHPVVVACIDSVFDYGSLKENQFKLAKRTPLGDVSIVGDGNGSLTVTVSSEASKRGRIDINLINPDNTAIFTLNTKGTMNIASTGKVNLKSDSEVNVEVSDNDGTTSYLNITKDEILQVSNSIKHNGGNEPMVLGDTLVSKIDKLLELLTESKVSTSIGLQPLVNFAEFEALRSELSEFLSEKSTLE